MTNYALHTYYTMFENEKANLEDDDEDTDPHPRLLASRSKINMTKIAQLLAPSLACLLLLPCATDSTCEIRKI